MSTIRNNRARGYKDASPKRRQYNRSAPPRRKTSTGWSMKLGAWAHARLREAQYDSLSRKVIQGIAIGAIAVVFITIAAGLGVIDDVGSAISGRAASTARFAGFAVHKVDFVSTEGRTMSEAQMAEAEAIAGIPSEEVMFTLSPTEIRDRIMVLPWVEGVIVRRLWPDTIQILVTPRAANALWQNNGNLRFIDASGKDLGPANPAVAKNYPLVIGANGNVAAPEIFKALSTRRQVAERTFAMVRVGQRRWNLRLRTGGEILLPEQNYEAALDNLENLQAQYRLLDRSFVRLDVRRPGFLLIRPSAEVTAATAQNV